METPPAPEGNTIEEKLASATKMAVDYHKQLGGAMKERDDALSAATLARTALNGEQTAHTATKGLLTAEQTAHATTTASLSTMTGDRDTQKAGKEKSEGRVTLIESFCKGKGLDLTGVEKSKAIKDLDEDDGKKTISKAEFDKLSPSAKSQHCLTGGTITE